ncbi:Proteasome subunit beta [Aphelenchoides besseyi]|nr:Proteasome subunit beta [Aphelenchoides besseyi]
MTSIDEQQQHGMSTVELEPSEAFDFSKSIRNVALNEMGLKAPNMTSSGTTIVAVVAKDGVVMGADSRSTGGNVVQDKFCKKSLVEHWWLIRLFQVSKMLSANLRLKELNTGKKARVVTAVKMAKQHLFQYQGHIGAYLLIGGVDATGPHLYDVSANGTSKHFPFIADGSGSYCAIAVLERDFKLNMSIEEAKALVQRALEAGMHGDNMSGNTLNLVIIKDTITEFENSIVPSFCQRPEPVALTYKFKPGTTTVLKQKIFKYDVVESMDIH